MERDRYDGEYDESRHDATDPGNGPPEEMQVLADDEGDDLAEIADHLFEESGDDEEALAVLLDRLDAPLVLQLITSDYLNAYQTFYYFFRVNPGELEKDRLILEPASSLLTGVLFQEIDLVDFIFFVHDGTPRIVLTDGESVLAEYSGPASYKEALMYFREYLSG